MTEAVCVFKERADLAEGPVWDPVDQVLYWIDCFKPTINRFDPATATNRAWTLPAAIGSLALREQGGAVMSLRSGFHFFDFDTGETTFIAAPEAHLPDNRFNDGKADRKGRFWAGTLRAKIPETDPVGSLYRLDADLQWSKQAGDIICSNGLGWSPDNKTMYFTDSRRYLIYAYDFDLESGAVENRRVFAQFEEGKGLPDGLAVDSEGGVWSALWDGWRVTRLDPDGRVEREVAIPAAKATSCIFGGPDLTTLYVTSASYGATADDLAKYPLTGGLFTVETGIKGLPEPRFAG